MAPPVQGLRGIARGLRSDGHPRHDPLDAPPPRAPKPKAPTGALTFKTGSKNQAVRDAIQEAGLTLHYLPRYSPDFSPIEPCWSKIKTALRAAAARTVETLATALSSAAANVTADDAVGWFQHCGYKVVS